MGECRPGVPCPARTRRAEPIGQDALPMNRRQIKASAQRSADTAPQKSARLECLHNLGGLLVPKVFDMGDTFSDLLLRSQRHLI